MWRTVTLRDICKDYKKDIVDGPFGANLKSEHFQSEGIPVLKIQNVKEFSLNRKKLVYVSPEKYQELRRHNFQTGDLIMTKLGAPLGVTAIVNDLEEGVIVADLVRIRIDEAKADRKFVEYQLNSPSIRSQINSAAKGATRPRIKLSVVRDLRLLLPPLAEQQLIVEKLDAAFAEIDRGIEVERAKLLRIQAFVGAKLESMFNDDRFEEKRLGDVCEFVGGSQPPKSTFEYEKTNDNIRLIQIRDYKSDKHITYIQKEKAKRWCSATDVMIGRYGPPIFQILRGIEGAYNVALMKAVPSDELDNDYLFYFLSNRRIQNYVINKSSRAAGQSGVNKDALKPYPINVPPKEQQLSIVRETHSLIEQSKSLENNCLKKLEAITSLKSAILTQELQPPQSKAA